MYVGGVVDGKSVGVSVVGGSVGVGDGGGVG
jgi:hypothetical protein